MKDIVSKEKIESILFEKINTNRLSNAYLIESNNYNQKVIVETLTKFLFGNSFNSDDLYILDYESEVIKKENIFDLKKYFSTKSLHNSKRVYIIKNAENMNLSFSNSLLKFLEEPEENIHAFLISNKIVTIPATIVSRCQTIRFPKEYNNFESDALVDSYLKELKESGFKTIVNRLKYIKEFKEKTYHVVLSYILNAQKNEIISNDSKSQIDLIKKILYLLEESKLSYNEELFFDRVTIALSKEL
jgi:DNA polymerase-3 subunit delta'